MTTEAQELGCFINVIFNLLVSCLFGLLWLLYFISNHVEVEGISEREAQEPFSLSLSLSLSLSQRGIRVSYLG